MGSMGRRMPFWMIGMFVMTLQSSWSHAAMLPVASAVRDGNAGDSHVNLSIGSLLLIIFFTALALYFTIGMGVRKFIGGATGYEIVPNYAFWSDIPLLIKDGAMFTLSGCRPEVVYERI